MKLTADFDARVVGHSDDLEGRTSPLAGLDGRMLDRIGDEWRGQRPLSASRKWAHRSTLVRLWDRQIRFRGEASLFCNCSNRNRRF